MTIDTKTCDSAQSNTLIVRCPECGSQKIGEVERALVTMEVKEFSRDEDGSLIAGSYTGEPVPDWQSSDPVDFPFQCMDCEQELTEEDLLIEESISETGVTA